jgi:hypothetical protein
METQILIFFFHCFVIILQEMVYDFTTDVKTKLVKMLINTHYCW